MTQGVRLEGNGSAAIASATTEQSAPAATDASQKQCGGASVSDHYDIGAGRRDSPRLGKQGTLAAFSAPSVDAGVGARSARRGENRRAGAAAVRASRGDPNRSGQIDSSAELASVIFAGYDKENPGPISIAPVEVDNAPWPDDGKPTFLVTISGMDRVDGQATCLGTALQAGNNLSNDLLDNAIAAIRELPEGSNIILAGHSLGGIVAQQLRSRADEEGEALDKYNVRHTVTFGSPMLGTALEGEGDLVMLSDTGDPVPEFNALNIGEGAMMETLNACAGLLGARAGGEGRYERARNERTIERCMPGADAMEAHIDSYANADTWSGIDGLGKPRGPTTLRFSPAERRFVDAPSQPRGTRMARWAASVLERGRNLFG